MNNHIFCIFPFTHINIDINGNARLCCRAAEAIRQDSPNTSAKAANIYADSLIDIWNSPSLDGIRDNMLNNVAIPACKPCYDQEAINQSSLRTMANEEFCKEHSPNTFEELIAYCRDLYQKKRYPLTSAHLWLSDNCNYRCRICSASFSTSIQQDELQCKYRPPILKYLAENRLDTEKWGNSNVVIQELFEISGEHLERVVFAGGEPLTNKGMLTIMESLIENGLSERILIKFNSNASILSKKLLDMFGKFKRVTVNLSIDGIGELNTYIRKGSQWDRIVAQIEMYKKQKKCFLFIHPTVCAYNIMGIHELLLFGHKHNVPVVLENFLVNPPYLSLRALPPSALKVAEEYYRDARDQAKALKISPHNYNICISFIEDALKNNTFAEHFTTFVEYTRLLDSDRNESIQKADNSLFATIRNEYIRRVSVPAAPLFCEIKEVAYLSKTAKKISRLLKKHVAAISFRR